ncbi:DUF1254 domain-containing protein [Roseibium sp.]|uniref:DUF1254 domain-containing protein n=1 Tax=Roseibium sp. TaxID=1936156 RepID=UPI001B0A194B|nr:DUF1254 domain-containing protein [Roseibium sp.]MBO6858563.1 DUF1254 domain-containing protein [Roseibium sp.]
MHIQVRKRPTLVRFLAAVTIVLIGSPVHPLQAQSITASPGEVREIAKEAFIYAYPMLYGYKTMVSQTQDPLDPGFIGGFGRYRHYTRLNTPEDKDINAPNNDTPYSWAWLDLRAEPWVLSLPKVSEDRYYTQQWFDLFTHNFAYTGARATGFEAGSYLFAGPDWDGPVPSAIKQVFRSESEFVGTLTRTELKGKADVEKMLGVQHSYVLQPLSEFAGQRPPVPAPDLQWPAWNESRALSADFIAYLNFLLQFTSPHPSETDLLARFEKIGVKASRPFDLKGLPREVQQALEDGVQDGLKEIEKVMPTLTNSGEVYGSREQLQNNYLYRAAGAYAGIYANSVEEAFYSQWSMDSDGMPLDGKNKYVIHFDKEDLPNVKFFWSVTLFDLPGRYLVANPIDRYSVGNRTEGVQFGDDGSLTVYVQHEKPEGNEAANWLPAPDGPFFVTLRCYGPDEVMINGEYKLPPMQLAP